MKRGFILLGESETARELLREAGEIAAALGVELVALSTITDEEYEHDLETLDAIERHDCDHVFVVGHSRSRAADALFGDAARYVVHHFDGSVTVRTG